MEQLIGDTFKIDEISGITMLHLSFLVKTLIQPRYFFEKNKDLKSVFDNNKDNFIRIGSAALGLHADLYDFTDIMPQSSFSISEKRAMTKYLSLTIVVIFPRQKYCIRDTILENVSDKDVLIIDDSATYPGYIRLRPTNTAYWSGCVEWLSCQEGFLRHLKVNRINDEIIKPFDCLSVEQFQGLEYGVWPRQAYNWTKREPQSGWPSKETIREASEKGCLIIRRAHEFSEHPDIEWQFVFNEAEKVLVQSFTDAMMYCFRVFKTLVNQTRNLKVKPKTYWQLTAMFYSSERIPHQVWFSNPGGCIMFLISWLYNHIHQKNLPHYFIPENNMIEHVDDEEMKYLETSLQAIRLFPFPSIYFLLESHSFLNLSVIDQIESSIEDYKLLEDKHKVVEMIFVPISFTLARRSVKYKLNPFYIQALEYIENAFELTINVKKEDDHTSFVDFILRFLSSVKDGEVKLPFAQLVDKEKKTNLSQLMLKHKASQTISNILEYTGVWGHVYIDVTENKWDSLFDILGGMFVGKEFEECAELLRCSILVLQRELNACQVDYSTITDDNVRKQLQSSNMKDGYGNLTYLVCFYKQLSLCYDMMNQIELFQEHIHDYEEIVSRIQSPGQYQNLAKIYRQLGNSEKAVELEEKVKSLMSSGGHGRVLMLLA
jgi:tetratricopeptide (TPR) repeat protein